MFAFWRLFLSSKYNPDESEKIFTKKRYRPPNEINQLNESMGCLATSKFEAQIQLVG